ncbi:MAG: restriction system protein [Chloroflexota bacterium]|jgi:HJR/Mrr/RecB family endonuclease|nr:restriction system protein [Chloroflexota bacterium]
MGASPKSKEWRPVVEATEGDGWMDRLMFAMYRAVERLPEKAQEILLVGVIVLGCLVTAFYEMPVGLRFLAAALTATATCVVTSMVVLSFVVQSPKWRLLEIQVDLADLRRMTGLQFEQFVAELLEARGFDVTRKGGGRADGGIDMLATQSGRTYVVQCKQWRQWIGRPQVQQLFGVVSSTPSVDGGIFVTTGVFSPEAREFERGLRRQWPRVRLVDGKELWAAAEELRDRPHPSPEAGGIAPA